MSLEGAIAVHRFGLGARPGEIDAASADPKAWLIAQIGTGAEQPVAPDGSAFSDSGTLVRQEQQLNQVTELLMDLLEGVDVDNPGQAVAAVMRTYTSGLSAHSAEIRALHEQCTASIARITSVLVKSYDVRLLRRMANKHWFPTATEWAAVAGEIDLGLPYFGLRLLCLKKDWRAVAMVMCKSSVSLMLLLDMDLDEL